MEARANNQDDLVECPDCGGSGKCYGPCALCQGKGGLNWHTGEPVPLSDVPLRVAADNNFEGKE